VSRCRRLRCQTNSRQTGAVGSAETSGSVEIIQMDESVGESSPAAHLLVRGLRDATAGSPACNTITAPAIVSAELRASELSQSCERCEAKPHSRSVLEAVCSLPPAQMPEDQLRDTGRCEC